MIRITEVGNKKEMRQFAGFPNRLYRDDPYYVPPLWSFQMELFDRKHNPFFDHTEAAFFLALNGNAPAGRIVAFVNERHIQHTGQLEGFFGFFDSTDNKDVGKALFAAAETWLAGKGMDKMTGPENFSTNEVCGILTHGFDDPPVFMMPYNKPYYAGLFENAGFEPIQELASFGIAPNGLFSKVESLCNAALARLKRSGITIRPISIPAFDRDIGMIREAYNKSFSNNWGFVPFTPEEFRMSAYNLKKISDPGTILLAVKEDHCLGFIVNVPDINQVLIHIRDGRIFPLGWINLLRYRNCISRFRILIMGVVPECRKSGIELALIAGTMRALAERKITLAEAAYVMDDNLPMKHILEGLGAKPVKRYRIYSKKIVRKY